MCRYDSERLYCRVRELRAQREQRRNSITFDEWLNELILIDCMTAPAYKCQAKIRNKKKHKVRGLTGQIPSQLYEPRYVSVEDAMRV